MSVNKTDAGFVEKPAKVRESWDNRLFSVGVVFILLMLGLLCLLPFVYLLAISLSSASPVMRGEVFLIPKQFTISVYQSIISNGSLVKAMGRSVLLTISYVIVSMVMTVLCAYPMAEAGLKGKGILWPYFIFTMYFSGGMIPSYLLVNHLGLIDSMLALILPGMISTYNMIVMRSFFSSIPASLKESALIDGAGDLKILTKIILPLSKPALATIALFYAVSRWTGMQDALLYINDPKKTVLQIKLRQMIVNAESVNEMLEGITGTLPVAQTIRAGALIFSLIPVLIIYPFLQKYFVKGVMIGAVKG